MKIGDTLATRNYTAARLAAFRPTSDPFAFSLANPLYVPVRAWGSGWSDYGGTVAPLTAVIQGGVVTFSGRVKNSGSVAHAAAIFSTPILFEPLLTNGAPGVLISSGGSTYVNSWLVFQGNITSPNCLLGISGGGSSNVASLDVNCSFKSSGKLGAAAYKRLSAVSDDASILFPPAVGPSLKVCMFHHANGGDFLGHITATPVESQDVIRPTILALLDDGWTILATSGGSNPSHWGNPSSWASTQAALAWLKEQFSVEKVAVLSASMGGLSGLRALVEYPDIKNWYGIYPVCDLTDLYPAYTAVIDTAYGGSSAYTAALPTSNPMQFTTGRFAGKNMRMAASASDTIVSKTANADAMATKVTGTAASIVVTTHTGNHGDASAFIPVDIVAHLNS